ncbi:metallopeptidase family protein [Flaviflagellibacter deserti]|uniref:Metallopeptidase family protein n=1 Tax=Flaviflagellibacter deserti TaxID=2267266 RepID=A0ABV9Z802_9HYPH
MTSTKRATEWDERLAPSLTDIEDLANRAYAELPDEFRRLTLGVVIRVEDFATQDVLDELKIESEFDLLGLFQGVGLAHDSAAPQTGRMPNMVFLYRRPILDYWAEHEETLGQIVTHVLVHEIGHHFGLSDEDMEEIEAAAG